MAKSVHTYAGKDITVTWDKQRCLHVAECVLGLRSVFDPSKSPWVQPDNETANQVASVIHRCPTGALQYGRHDGQPNEVGDPQNSIRVASAGPLYARGQITLTLPDGPVTESRVALCRCGHSSNKPYCDGSHSRVGFDDRGHGTQKAIAESLPNGPITMLPRPDASLLIEGPVEIESSDGRIIFRGEKVSLCRCGKSQSKPFCDGSHKQVAPAPANV